MANPIASVDFLIVRDEKILLGRVARKWTNDGRFEWGLPGREIEFGDNFETTIKNNLKKELNMELASFKIISINNNFAFGNHYIAIGIEVLAKGEPKTMNEDWLEWKWFQKNEIPDKLFPSAKLTLKCYKEGKISIN